MSPAQLRAMFLRERRRFAKISSNAGRAGLVVRDRHVLRGKCAFRDIAWADLDTRTVYILTRALKFPAANLRGVIRHELGHLADPTPNRFGAEQRADDLAERATGQKIRYDRRDVQTVGRGQYPRPRHLHQNPMAHYPPPAK